MDKQFYKSKTIIGAVVSVLPVILPAVGVSFTADDQVLVSTTVDAGFTFFGFLLTLYGRFKTEGNVHLLPPRKMIL